MADFEDPFGEDDTGFSSASPPPAPPPLSRGIDLASRVSGSSAVTRGAGSSLGAEAGSHLSSMDLAAALQASEWGGGVGRGVAARSSRGVRREYPAASWACHGSSDPSAPPRSHHLRPLFIAGTIAGVLPTLQAQQRAAAGGAEPHYLHHERRGLWGQCAYNIGYSYFGGLAVGGACEDGVGMG